VEYFTGKLFIIYSSLVSNIKTIFKDNKGKSGEVLNVSNFLKMKKLKSKNNKLYKGMYLIIIKF